jgi:hypothetical protein
MRVARCERNDHPIVQRIEEHLGISDPKKPEPFGCVTEPSPTVHIPRPTRPSLIEPKPDTHEESSRPAGWGEVYELGQELVRRDEAGLLKADEPVASR